jgi:hypothetical protein
MWSAERQSGQSLCIPPPPQGEGHPSDSTHSDRIGPVGDRCQALEPLWKQVLSLAPGLRRPQALGLHRAGTRRECRYDPSK